MVSGFYEHFRKPENFFNYMPERKNPVTSLAAYKNLHQEQKDAHYKKITDALRVLGSGTADGISEYLKMEHVQINRRMIELERDQKIYKSGLQKPTRRGRNAFVWFLCEPKTSENNFNKPLKQQELF